MRDRSQLKRSHVIAAALASAGLAAVTTVWLSSPRAVPPPGAAAETTPVQDQQQAEPTPDTLTEPAPISGTIASTGRIAGIAIGDPLEEARGKLEPLRVPGAEPADEKEQQGRRFYRKLKETEYDWIMVWGKEGKVSRIRAMYRPDKAKPFSEIGDLTSAATADDTTAKWNLQQPNQPHYRLIAQGQEQRAISVYMFALESSRGADEN